MVDYDHTQTVGMPATSGAPFPQAQERAPGPSHPVRPRIHPGQMVPAADGSPLATDVFLPAAEGAWPVAVVRTPYNRKNLFMLRLAKELNAAGLAVVLQDCRGRFGSPGRWDWRLEAGDTRACLEWLPRQPWFGRRVVMIGLSISSLPMFQIAVEGPPEGVSVAALVNVMGVVDLHSLFYRDGALLLHWALPWCLQMGSSQQTPDGWRNIAFGPLWRSPHEVRPPAGVDPTLWRQVLAEPRRSAYWEAGDARAGLGALEIPTLHLSGWLDFTLGQTLDAYQAVGGDKTLIVGPWSHDQLADAMFRPPPGGGRPLVAQLVTWLDQRLELSRGGPGGTESGSAHLFVSDVGWHRTAGFPPAGSQPEDHYLSAGAEGDGGTLSTAPPLTESRDRFRYDPDDPAPSKGGNVWKAPALHGIDPGRAEQSEIERRADVLVYTGAPLADHLMAVGRPTVELWVSTSAPATDVTAKLVDLDPNGKAWSVSDGILRLPRGERGLDEGIAPETPRKIEIRLDAIGYRFARGHRLRLEVSSSNFPKYDRSLNGAEPSAPTPPPASEQSIFHGPERPSRLRVPVVPEEAFERRPGLVLTGRAGELPPKPPPQPWRRRVARDLKTSISRQFARPRGLLGVLTGRVLAHSNRELNRWSIELLDVRSEDRVLEIGFGPGRALGSIARRATAGRVTGLDHSELMVDQARIRHWRAIRDRRMDVLHGSVESLPEGLGRFDKILSVNSAYLWPQRVRCLSDLRDRLKPGGVVLLTMQPRWLPDEAAVRREATTLAAELRRAGFDSVSVSFRSVRPVLAVAVRGVRHPALADCSNQ